MNEEFDEQTPDNPLNRALTQSQMNINAMQEDNMTANLQSQMSNLMKEQLDCGDLLEMLEHLLKGEVKIKNPDGDIIWEKAKKASMSPLTDHGVHLIMNAVQFYINKNTLLSNYTEETINHKLFDFGNTLNDVLFMESDDAFKNPTWKEVEEKYSKTLNQKIDKMCAVEKIKGRELSREKARTLLLKDVDVDKMLEGIKAQLKNDPLKRFELTIRVVQDAIHSTYLRAWNGQERRSLRENIRLNIMEGGGSTPQQSPLSQKRGGFFSAFRRKR